MRRWWQWGLVLILCGLGLGAPRPVAAVDWATGSGFPAPSDAAATGAAFVPFDNVLGPVAQSSSRVLTNAAGNNVGVEITDGPNQSGAIWSNTRVDLMHDFSAKLLYRISPATNPADGMAFVLAGMRPPAVGNSGGALGIWQVKNAPGLAQSFAIALDTHYDKKRVEKNVTQTSQYVAWGFPGQKYQYEDKPMANGAYPLLWPKDAGAGDGGLSTAHWSPSDFFEPHNKSGLGGYQPLSGTQPLSDGQWHPLTVTWQSNGDGGGSLVFNTQVGAQTVAKTLTWSKEQVAAVFGDTQVYWGFTGATGTESETALVAFEKLPGVLANSLTTSVAAPAAVHPGTAVTQQYQVTYDGDESQQSWPLEDGEGHLGTLAAMLTTGSHYGFVVTDGHVVLHDQAGHEFLGTPGATQTVAGYTFTTRVQVSLPGFRQAHGAQALTLKAPLVATSVGAGEQVAAGTITGNNGTLSAPVTLPAVTPQPAIAVAVPTFDFGTLSVGQVVAGVRAQPSAKVTTQTLTWPGGGRFGLYATLQSFALGPDYRPGAAQVAFRYGAQQTQLRDDGQAQLVASGDATPAAPTQATLTLPPYAHVQSGQRYAASIRWELRNAPE